MEIRKIPISQINRAKYNPRVELRPGDPKYQAIEESIDEFGYIDPIVWNERNGVLVGGHQRLTILENKGFTDVEVSVVNLDNDREKLLNLVLNKTEGEWQRDKYNALVCELHGKGALSLSMLNMLEDELTAIVSRANAVLSEQNLANAEINADEFAEKEFDHNCPRCGFSFNE